MSLNKKGDWNTVSKWIYALVIIVILWIVFVSFGDFLYGSGNKAACKNWVYRNSVSVAKEVVGDFENSPCITTEEKIKEIDETKMYEKLAQNMYDCWDQYGQGDVDFYSDIDWGSSDAHCRICSEIEFDEKVKKEIKEIDVDRFEIYLSNNNPPNHKETYAEFFTKSDNSKIDFGSGKIPLEDKFYTMFVVNKRGDYSFMGFLNKLIILPVTAIAGGSQIIPFADKLPKAFGGLVRYTKYTSSTAPIMSAGGSKLGTVTTKIGTSAKGGGLIGMAIIYTTVVSTSFLADGSILYPTLSLVSSDSPKIGSCSYIYYQPEKKPLNFQNRQN
jgi:hypothetical protein